MKDLQSISAMWLKGVLFLLIGMMSGGILLIDHGSLRMALLLGLCVWGCACGAFAGRITSLFM